MSLNRIVIGDTNTSHYRHALQKFRDAGWEVSSYGNTKDLLRDVMESPPRLLLVNLMLQGGSGLAVLDAVQKQPDRFKATKVLMVSSFATKENIRECFRRGAKDFLITPFPQENLFPRLLYHLQEKKELVSDELEEMPTLAEKKNEKASAERQALSTVLEALNISALGGSPFEALFKFVKLVEKVVKVSRCSCIIGDTATEQGWVLASNDDQTVRGLRLNLGKYPEVSHVINTGLIVIVDDIKKNPLTQEIQNQVKTIKISSLMVLPVRMNGEVIGAFSLRGQEPTNPFTIDVARICQAICTAAAPVVQFVRKAQPNANATPVPSGEPEKKAS